VRAALERCCCRRSECPVKPPDQKLEIFKIGIADATRAWAALNCSDPQGDRLVHQAHKSQQTARSRVLERAAAMSRWSKALPLRRGRNWRTPSSAWTAKANKRVQFGYGLNYLIDLGPHAVIVDVEGTPARTYDEVAATQTMINRTEETFGLKLKRLAADTAYGTGKALGKGHHPAYPRVGEIPTN
jgi:hypothetical protein